MRTFEENEKDIQKLEEEIRKLGMPYSHSEPEPLYWANFRVRVMDRIEAKAKRAPWPTRILEFLAEHILWTSISAAAACLLVAAILAFQPTSSEAPQLAAVSQPTASTPQMPAPAPPPPSLQPAKQHTTFAHPTNRSHPTDHRSWAQATPRHTAPAENFAVAEPFEASPTDEAVSLESLSQPELESVLAGLQSNDNGN